MRFRSSPGWRRSRGDTPYRSGVVALPIGGRRWNAIPTGFGPVAGLLQGCPADEKIIRRFRDIAAAPAACGWIHIIIELKVL